MDEVKLEIPHNSAILFFRRDAEDGSDLGAYSKRTDTWTELHGDVASAVKALISLHENAQK